jgi:hypothetical protein
MIPYIHYVAFGIVHLLLVPLVVALDVEEAAEAVEAVVELTNILLKSLFCSGILLISAIYDVSTVTRKIIKRNYHMMI